MTRRAVLASACLATILLATAGLDLTRAGGTPDHRAYQIGAGAYPRLDVTNAHGTLQVVKSRSGLDVRLDGQPVQAEQLQREGSIYSVLDPSNQKIFVFGFFEKSRPSGQIIYSPDFDPYTVKSTLGLWAVALDEPFLSGPQKRAMREMAVEAGLDPERMLVVSRVIEGSPAAAAGVREFDLLTHAGGNEVGNARNLHRLATDKQGNVLELGLLREGQSFDVNVSVLANLGWPDVDSLERRFKKVLRP